ncbi:hypothetical protein ACN6LM_004795 [Streptomyces sp. SAS_281]|uniref:hypothetical protein n=1 Tax=Streptomyces sp. SAS_281 TaxID=3412744 RepID=UPI00403C16E1
MTFPGETQLLMETGRVRRLTPEDIDDILQIVELEGMDAPTLLRELVSEGDYLWMGLDLPAGGLGAVHRSMRWGNHLLLKGVFVDEPLRGSGAALELAFALRDAARNDGYAGIAAWVEPNKPEAALAHMLRLQSTGTLMHRFEIPAPNDGPCAIAPLASCGLITVELPEPAVPTPLVEDLLNNGLPAAVHWVHDRHRLVLSGFPPHSIGQLDLVLSAAGPVAQAKGTHWVEFPVPAADLPAAFSLAALKARRIGRTPVRLGRLDFGATHHAADRGARRNAVHDTE